MRRALWIAVAVLAGASAARADPLPQFLQETISEDLSQILVGQLAGRTSDSPDVRDFGRALAEDHTAIELKAIDLAGRMGIAQPTQASDEGRQEYARLQQLSGQDFDRAFLRYASFQLEAEITELKSVAADKQSPAAGFAKNSAALLQKDLETAKGLQRGG